MRSLALVLVVMWSAVGCGSSLMSPDGGCVAPPPIPGDCNSCSCANGMLVCTTLACPPPSCALDTTYRFGDTGGLVAYEDSTTLTPPGSYTHTRSPRFTDPADLTCSPALPGCNSTNLVDVADVMLDIASGDVVAALASATPPTYGIDARPYDGTIFQFLRDDGRGFLAGNACGTGGTGCVDVPAGVAKLVADLRALDAQQLQDPTCTALR